MSRGQPLSADTSETRSTRSKKSEHSDFILVDCKIVLLESDCQVRHQVSHRKSYPPASSEMRIPFTSVQPCYSQLFLSDTRG